MQLIKKSTSLMIISAISVLMRLNFNHTACLLENVLINSLKDVEM